MNFHENDKRVFALVGQIAAERSFSDDQIMQCLGACLKLLDLDSETAIATERCQDLIAAYWTGAMLVPWWLAGDDPGSHHGTA
ncbi:MAG: hypothetical protein H7Y60_02255 [Rhodospirillaceae bacterium]|nr:hypothetical protein [Rhodospirillales bacterium]